MQTEPPDSLNQFEASKRRSRPASSTPCAPYGDVALLRRDRNARVSHALETRFVACVLCSARGVRHEHTIGVVCASLDPFAADETRRRAGHAVLFDALL